MPELEFILACRLISIDAQSGSLSVFHLIEEVTTIERPDDPHPDYYLFPAKVVTRWHWVDGETGGDYAQRLSLVTPDGTEMDLGLAPIPFR